RRARFREACCVLDRHASLGARRPDPLTSRLNASETCRQHGVAAGQAGEGSRFPLARICALSNAHKLITTHETRERINVCRKFFSVRAGDYERRCVGRHAEWRGPKHRTEGVSEPASGAKRAEILAQLDARYRGPLRSYFR